MTDWFETWFNSRYYHLLYKKRDDDEAHFFLDNLVKYLQLPNEAKILDLACGKGRHSKYLASKGFEVCGVDLSTNSINEAQKNACENLNFYVHDMRKIFRVNYFDAVCSFFTSMGYFEKQTDDEKQIHAMQAAAKAGGSVVIDFMNAKKIIKNLIPQQRIEIENCVFEINKKVVDNFILKTITVFENRELKMNACEKVKCFTLSNFEQLLQKQNLQVKNIFGDYALNNFDEEKSDRLIIHAIKK